MTLWSKTPEEGYVRRYRASHRKLPEERQMLCTDIQVPAGAPMKAFVKAWNLMVGHGLRYIANFRQTTRTGEDELMLWYRASEIARLLQERDRIRGFDYKLSIKILDHIEVTPVGKLAVIFLTGKRENEPTYPDSRYSISQENRSASDVQR